MTMPRKLVSVHASEALIDDMDALIGVGKAGDSGYFASRSEFVRRAMEKLVEDLRSSAVSSSA